MGTELQTLTEFLKRSIQQGKKMPPLKHTPRRVQRASGDHDLVPSQRYGVVRQSREDSSVAGSAAPDSEVRPGMNRLRAIPLPFVGLLLTLVMASRVAGAAVARAEGTILAIKDTQFTLDGQPAFLLGFSYYGGLGAPDEFVREDVADFHARGFNWLRVWATWAAFGEDVSAVTVEGKPRERYLGRLKSLVAQCDKLGMAVDITLTRGRQLPDIKAHRAAVETLVTELKTWRNWYLDLGNERDVNDARYVSSDEVKDLRAKVRALDPERLVTASFGGHDLTRDDVRAAVETAGLDFLTPHRPRTAKSPGETEAATRQTLSYATSLGHGVPVHYQEPFRRGYTVWQPSAADFLADLRGALAGGAAGWCFHNGSQRSTPGEQPRRSFDLRTKRLMGQLDGEDLKVVEGAKAVLVEQQRAKAASPR
jgi:hypothetical protein